MTPGVGLIGLLALARAGSPLTPEAAEHNREAMVFYDAGQLAPAVDEFLAAYRSMPDPRRHRAGRLQLLGSMRMTLLALHEQTGEAAPLCRLEALLMAHADALAAAYPDYPDMPELRSIRAIEGQATRQLAAFGPDACEPASSAAVEVAAPRASAVEVAAPETEPAAVEVAAVPVNASAMMSAPGRARPIAARPFKIAGGTLLGVAVGLVGGVVYGVVTQRRQRALAREVDARADHYLTQAESDALHGHLAQARFGRHVAIGTGTAAGLTAATATALLVLARRSSRVKRLAAAAWWSPAGAGLTLRVEVR